MESSPVIKRPRAQVTESMLGPEVASIISTLKRSNKMPFQKDPEEDSIEDLVPHHMGPTPSIWVPTLKFETSQALSPLLERISWLEKL